MTPEKLERLAELLDGLDDEAAAEARQKAQDLRNKLIVGPEDLDG